MNAHPRPAHTPHAGALATMGATESRAGRADAARVMLARSLALRPDHAPTLLNYGIVLHQLGRDAEALLTVERTLSLNPEFARAWGCYASLLHRKAQRSGDQASLGAAAHAYRTACRLGDGDPESIAFALASLGAAEQPGIAPRAYVERLFDDYAPTFDSHLCDGLGYRAPEMLVSALARTRGIAPADTVDLGCGTGQCGPLLRPSARRLAGVDLSRRMLEVAAQRSCYDTLTHDDVMDFLCSHPATFDLAVAADVLVYIGDLFPLLQAAHGALRADGWLAFTVERHDGEGFGLHVSRRYTHSITYLAETAARAGFEVVALTATTVRMDAGLPVKGALVLLRRSP